MQADPRTKNIWFNSTSLNTYFSDYKKALSQAMETIPQNEMEKAYKVMVEVAKRGGTFFVAGNGGSAAIADHLCCDWTKGTYGENLLPLRTLSLGSNAALMTAIGNDFGYDEVFSRHLKMMAKPTDALFVISSSGNSPNIVNAIKVAQEISIPSIALTGFAGGKARDLATVKIHVEYSNYAIVEDCHQAAMQTLAQYFFAAQSPQK